MEQKPVRKQKDYIETRYYKILTNKRGQRLLMTKKKILADAICYCTEKKIFIFDDADGTKTYSIECDERTQMIAEQLVSWHFEALKINQENK